MRRSRKTSGAAVVGLTLAKARTDGVEHLACPRQLGLGCDIRERGLCNVETPMFMVPGMTGTVLPQYERPRCITGGVMVCPRSGSPLVPKPPNEVAAEARFARV